MNLSQNEAESHSNSNINNKKPHRAASYPLPLLSHLCAKKKKTPQNTKGTYHVKSDLSHLLKQKNQNHMGDKLKLKNMSLFAKGFIPTSNANL